MKTKLEKINLYSLISITMLIALCITTQNVFAQVSEELENEIITDAGNGALSTLHFARCFNSESIQDLSKIQSNSSVLENVKNLGPLNSAGRTRAILVDRVNPLLMFAGGTSGGLFRSTDKGATWYPINDQTVGLNVTCIDQSPFNPAIIYYGTGETKNVKISDTGSGVYRSTDNGLTFAQLAATNNQGFKLINSVKHSLTNANTIYVATTKSGVYKSTDAGNSFNLIFNHNRAINDIECFPDGHVLITSGSEGIFTSPTGDSGTFVKRTVGLPAFGFSRIETAYCEGFPSVVFATFADSLSTYTSGLNGVYKSSDGGATWHAVTNPTNISSYIFADYMMSIAVRPNDSNYVICAGEKGSYSFDGGLSWTKLDYNRVDQHTIVFDQFDPNLLLIGNDQGVTKFRLAPQPINPTSIINKYTIGQLWAGSFFPIGNNCLSGAQDNNFILNKNGDSLFSTIYNYGINGTFTHVSQQDSNLTYIAVNRAKIYRCDSSFKTKPVYNLVLNELDTNHNNEVDDDTWSVNHFEMNLLDGKQIYLPTRWRVWRTIDKGNHWIPITNNYKLIGRAPLSIGISNSVYPTVYAGGDKGFFCRIDSAYSSTAGQETDLSVSVPNSLIPNSLINCIAVHPLNIGILYVAIENDYDTVSRVWKITNANTSNPQWIDINGNLDKTVNVHWIEIDPNNSDSVFFAGTDYGLYVTTDAGKTWSRDTRFPLITIYQMRLRKTDRKLFVFTFGRGVWIADLHSTCDPVLALNTVTSTTAKVSWAPTCAPHWNINLRKKGATTWTGFTTDSISTTFVNLDSGIVYEVQVKAFVDSTLSFKWSPSLFFTTLYTCPVPINLSTTNITATSARLNWTNVVSSAKVIRFRLSGTSTWNAPNITTGSVATYYNLTGLLPDTTYEWQMKTKCSSTNFSAFSAKKTFKTLKVVRVQNDATSNNIIEIIPNPNKGNFTVNACLNFSGNATVVISDINKQEILRQQVESVNGLLNTRFNVSGQSAGVYFLTVITSDGEFTKKFLIE